MRVQIEANFIWSLVIIDWDFVCALMIKDMHSIIAIRTLKLFRNF